jgi:CheY-like chemotaxis protein
MRKKPLFLIAEDDLDDQYLIQNVVEEVCSADLETRFLRDGVELMDYLRDELRPACDPRLVLLDLNMPRKDGRTALRELKSDPHLAKIPVVILTTSSTLEDRSYCERYGVEGYYHKPSSMAEMRSIFGKLCVDFLSGSQSASLPRPRP